MRRTIVAVVGVKHILLVAFMVGLLQVCLGNSPIVHAQQQELEPNDAQESFEYLWKSFDEKYALFNVKGVDWNALYRVYRPRVRQTTTDDELFGIMSNLLRHLNDNHVMLTLKNRNRFFSAGYVEHYFSEAGGNPYDGKSFMDVMGERPVPNDTLREFRERANGIFAYGWAGDGVGYLHFNRVANMEASRNAIDEIMAAFKDAKAIIIDVRRNRGGDDRVGKMIADRFADRRRLYMTTRDRNGPKHDDFADPKEWCVEPDGPIQFTKTTLLLTDRTSLSAAENFALAMKVLPHVVQIGDFTSGCFADPEFLELPNGWGFSISRNLFSDSLGFCWEGIGVPPEIWQPTTKADVNENRDRVFELAMAIIDSGGVEPKRLRRGPEKSGY